MPTANMGVPVKYQYMDHARPRIDIAPPVQNQWYTVFDDVDVRLLMFDFYQTNTESALKTIQFRETRDSHIYEGSHGSPSGTICWVYINPNAGGVAVSDLDAETALSWGPYERDTRAHNYKVEIRMTTAPGTNQHLVAECVYETLEQVSP